MSRESGAMIEAVTGDTVAIDQSAVGNIDAARVELRQAAAQRVHGESMDVTDSALLSVHAADVRMQDCASLAVVGEHVTLRESTSLIVFARQVDGDVKRVMTPAAAFALGAGVAVGIGLVKWLRR